MSGTMEISTRIWWQIGSSAPRPERCAQRLPNASRRPTDRPTNERYRMAGLMAFAGRVLFASVFLLSAYQEFSEFGVNGGPAAKALRPKFNRFMKHATAHLGVAVPHIEMKHVITATIILKGLGGLLFIFSSSFGACLLLLHLAFITPIVYDFYNYDMEKPEFVQLFIKFAQNLALFGALLYFLGMKNSIPRRSKRAPKVKKT